MKLTKKLLAMALAGVMLLTIPTGCSGGKTGDRLVEEYMAAFLSENLGYKDIPIPHDVPEIKTVADMFKASWLNEHGDWAISPNSSTYTTLRNVFSNYENGYRESLRLRGRQQAERAAPDHACYAPYIMGRTATSWL